MRDFLVALRCIVELMVAIVGSVSIVLVVAHYFGAGWAVGLAFVGLILANAWEISQHGKNPLIDEMVARHVNRGWWT